MMATTRRERATFAGALARSAGALAQRYFSGSVRTMSAARDEDARADHRARDEPSCRRAA
jgi:hypothetical protein